MRHTDTCHFDGFNHGNLCESCHCEDCAVSVTVEDMAYLDRLTRVPSPKNGARYTIGEE